MRVEHGDAQLLAAGRAVGVDEADLSNTPHAEPNIYPTAATALAWVAAQPCCTPPTPVLFAPLAPTKGLAD